MINQPVIFCLFKNYSQFYFLSVLYSTNEEMFKMSNFEYKSNIKTNKLQHAFKTDHDKYFFLSIQLEETSFKENVNCFFSSTVSRFQCYL
jgi:hypothetical protein